MVPFENIHTGRGLLNHGTHVLGTLAAIHNDVGISGVVDLPREYVFSFDAFGSIAYFGNQPLREMVTDRQARQGLVWSVENGARVVNFSIGYNERFDHNLWLNLTTVYDRLTSFYHTTMTDLLDDGHDFLIIFAAGNATRNTRRNGFWSFINDPELRERIITVGSINRYFALAQRTN